MAQYTVHHACGHERTVALFGPHVERDNKIRWMEGQDCPQCWGAKKREAEAQMPIAMTIRFNGLDTDTQGNPVAEIILTGGTAPRKEEIKAMGYSFQEVRGGVLDFLSASRAPMAWVRTVPMAELFSGDKNAPLNETQKRIETEAATLGAAVDMNVSPFDLEIARKKLAEKAAKDAALANLTKPVRPEGIFPEPGTGKWSWNGKVYGKAQYGYRIYIRHDDSRDGDEVNLTAEQAERLNAYVAAKAAYAEAVKKITEETTVEQDG